MKNEGKKIKSASVTKILWALLSVFLAFIFWVYYTANFGEEISATFYGVEVVYTGEEDLRDSLNLVISQEDTVTVNVTVSGSRRYIQRLTEKNIQAVVDLSGVSRSGYRAMSYSLSYPTEVDAGAITVEKRNPEYVSLVISKLTSKVFTVEGINEGNVAAGYVADVLEVSPATVVLTGTEEVLSSVARVCAYAGKDGVTSTYTTDSSLVYLDAEGNEIAGSSLTSDTDIVSVTVPVNMTKEVQLTVDCIDGGGATAAGNVIKTITPSSVTLAGPASILEGINVISLATIDLSDYSSFPSTEYSIVIPNETDNISGISTATVNIEFVGLSMKLFTVKNLDYVNLTDGYTASVMTDSLVVTVRAPEAVIDQISENNIRAVADLTNLTTTAKAPTTIYIDGFSEAGAVGDYAVYVEILSEE